MTHTASRPWSEDEDMRLIAWGCCMQDGHAFVARHDLGRTEQEGRERIEVLRREKPDLVKRIEAEVDA